MDDEYVIIGSANINQRSMDGRRDSEIGIGCYQPKFTNNKRTNHQLLGAVHAYRISLWYEHTRRIEATFMEPRSLECVKRMCEIGDEMWRVYSGNSVVDMEGVHLVSYPVSVSNDGDVSDLRQGGGTFPDTNTLVRGRKSRLLPPIFTT